MSSKKIGTIAIVIGVIAIVTSSVLLMRSISEENTAIRHAEHAAEAFIDKIVNTSSSEQTPHDDVIVSEDGEEINIILIDDTAYMGVLTIPTLNLSLPVNAAWSYEALKSTPCRFSGSIENNTLVIMAHNYRGHFREIQSLETGDIVTLTDTQGTEHIYQVVSIETMPPTEANNVKHSNYDLTLFTCTNEGQARVVVRTMRVQ